MKTEFLNSSEKVAIFHTRKATYRHRKETRFVKFDSSFSADYFGVNVYFTFENIGKLSELIESDAGDFIFNKMKLDIDDLACNWEKYKNDFDTLMETNNIDFSAAGLGRPIVVGDSQNELCTVEEYNSSNGYLDIDGDFDSYSWMKLSDLEIDDLKIICDDSIGLNSLFYEINQPDSVKLLISLKADSELIAECIYHSYSVEDLIKEQFIELDEDGEYILC